MTLEQAVIDLWMAGVVASLTGVALIVMLWAGMSIRLVAGARRRTRRPPPHLGQLSRWCAVSELAEVDQALDRILAEHQAAHPGLHGQ